MFEGILKKEVNYMGFKEMGTSNFLDGVIQEIDCETSFVDIVDIGNCKYTNISQQVGTPEETSEEPFEETLGEIDLERVRFLLSADDMLEEMLFNKK